MSPGCRTGCRSWNVAHGLEIEFKGCRGHGTRCRNHVWGYRLNLKRQMSSTVGLFDEGGALTGTTDLNVRFHRLGKWNCLRRKLRKLHIPPGMPVFAQ